MERTHQVRRLLTWKRQQRGIGGLINCCKMCKSSLLHMSIFFHVLCIFWWLRWLNNRPRYSDYRQNSRRCHILFQFVVCHLFERGFVYLLVTLSTEQLGRIIVSTARTQGGVTFVSVCMFCHLTWTLFCILFDDFGDYINSCSSLRWPNLRRRYFLFQLHWLMWISIKVIIDHFGSTIVSSDNCL